MVELYQRAPPISVAVNDQMWLLTVCLPALRPSTSKAGRYRRGGRRTGREQWPGSQLGSSWSRRESRRWEGSGGAGGGRGAGSRTRDGRCPLWTSRSVDWVTELVHTRAPCSTGWCCPWWSCPGNRRCRTATPPHCCHRWPPEVPRLMTINNDDDDDD